MPVLHTHANDPYFLYGASNFGSLIALLSYPIAIEPIFGLSVQASLWTKGFVLLALLITASGLLMLVASIGGTLQANAATSRAQISTPTARPTLANRLSWIALAFVPSGLLVVHELHRDGYRICTVPVGAAAGRVPGHVYSGFS